MRKADTAGTLPRIRVPIIVEGRYDKAAICSLFSATVITTEGFGIFNSAQKQALIRRISGDGIILLTDSDGGGKQIRSFVSGIIPPERIYQLYIPRVEGKERRKVHRSKEGMLGVEGIGSEVLYKLLSPFVCDEGQPLPEHGDISSVTLYTMGLTGAESASELRDFVCRRLSLPCGMGAKAFLAAVNIISSEEELREIVSSYRPE